MTVFFDLCAGALLVAAAGLYFFRLRTERPPATPYLVSVASCGLGYWTGVEGSAFAGTIIMVAVGFLLVHLASEPFSDDGQAS